MDTVMPSGEDAWVLQERHTEPQPTAAGHRPESAMPGASGALDWGRGGDLLVGAVPPCRDALVSAGEAHQAPAKCCWA